MSVVDQHDDASVEDPRPLRRKLRGGRRLRDGRYLYWWVEILFVIVFYVVYSTIRNLHHGNPDEAFRHARELISLQRDLGINHEQAIQDWALGWRPLIIAANYFYGSLHFIVTGGVMIYLYRKWSDDYPALAQHARGRHRARAHRLRALPAHAAAAARRLLQQPPEPVVPLRLRRHAGEGPFVLVVQLRRGQQDLQPVRGHAERALRVGALVRVRARPPAAALVGQGARGDLPGHDGDGDRAHRQPLLPRRAGGLPRPRHRLPRGARVHPRRPRPGDRAVGRECRQSEWWRRPTNHPIANPSSAQIAIRSTSGARTVSNTKSTRDFVGVEDREDQQHHQADPDDDVAGLDPVLAVPGTRFLGHALTSASRCGLTVPPEPSVTVPPGRTRNGHPRGRRRSR